jgi:PKD repeat protein
MVVSAPSANVGAPVAFNASGSSDSDDSITGYNFSFGDLSWSGWTPNSTAVHAYAAGGNYSAAVTVRDEEGNETTSAAVTVQVTGTSIPRPRIVITHPTENEVFSARTVTVSFTVTDFAVANGSSHIHFYLDNGTVVMWYSLAPYTYTGVSNGNHTLKAVLADPAHVELANPEATAVVNFHVSPIELADLTLTASDITVKPAKPKDGETVTLSAVIYNTGDTDAKSFNVRFLVDGKNVGDKTVTALAKGATIVREVTWTAKAGSHTLKVVIDPTTMIPELDETNNMASVNLSVAGAAAGSDQWLMIAILVIVIIMVAAVAAILMMRQKKPATVIPYQPPAAYAPITPHQPLAPPAAVPSPPPQPPAVPAPAQQPPPVPPPT